jgi:hypothetical protein
VVTAMPSARQMTAAANSSGARRNVRHACSRSRVAPASRPRLCCRATRGVPSSPVERSVGERSARSTSVAVAGRAAGSFSISRATSASSAGGTSPRRERTGVGTVERCARASAEGVAPVNGGCPVSISYASTPSA